MLGFSLIKFIVVVVVAVSGMPSNPSTGLSSSASKELATSRKPKSADFNNVGGMIKFPKLDTFVAVKGQMNCGC